MLGVLVEPILLLGLWVAAQVAGSTHISNIADTIYHWPVARSIPLILALCACAFATFIEMGKLPFDGGSGAGVAGRAVDRIQR